MAAHAARRLVRMNANLNVIIGVEAMCGVQGIEFRTPLQTSTALQAAMAALRTKVATLAQDRYMAPSIEAAADMIATGTLCGAVDLPPFVQGFAE
jgi:histidine ammonia-lyase